MSTVNNEANSSDDGQPAGSASSSSNSELEDGKSDLQNENHNQVTIHVYDITNGEMMRKSGGLVEGVWHTGVEVFGVEHFYSKYGVLTIKPKQYELGTYHESLPMGPSRLNEQQFNFYLKKYKTTTYQGHLYNEIFHNCRAFAEEMVKLLVGRGIPEDVIWKM